MKWRKRRRNGPCGVPRRSRTVKSLSPEREIWFIKEGVLPGSDESAPQSAMQQSQSTEKSFAAGHLGGRLGDAAEAAAECDDSPDHRVPIPPHRLRLLAHHCASDLGDAAENFRDGVRDLLIL